MTSIDLLVTNKIKYYSGELITTCDNKEHDNKHHKNKHHKNKHIHMCNGCIGEIRYPCTEAEFIAEQKKCAKINNNIDKVCCMRSGRPPTTPPPCHKNKDFESCKNSGGCTWNGSKCAVYYAPTTYTMVPRNKCKTFPGHNGGIPVDSSKCSSK